MRFYAFCYIINLLDIQGIVNMNAKKDLENQAMAAAAQNGMSSIMVRNALGRKLGLNITDGQCMSILGIRGTSTPTELARYTGLTTGSTTAMLDRLERAGFIRRVPNPKDRRGVLVEIDEEWGKTAGPLVAGIQQANRELLASYSPEELEIITDFLMRFTKNTKDHTEIIEKGPAS